MSTRRKYRIVIERIISGSPLQSEHDVVAKDLESALRIVSIRMHPVGKYSVVQVWQHIGKKRGSQYWKIVPWKAWKDNSSKRRCYADRLEEEFILAIKPIAEKYRRRMKKGSRPVQYHCVRALERIFPWGGKDS